VTTRQGLRINFDAKEVVRDPFPVYEEIRSEGTVVFNELLGVWMVVGYEDLNTALHNPTRFSNEAYGSAEGPAPEIINGARMMISTDPPEQIPLRKVAQQAFLRSSLAKLERTIETVVEELLDSPELRDTLAGGGEVEMMDAFCKQVPARVIALLLGVPVTDLRTFIDWSDDLTAVMDSGQRETPEWPTTVAKAKRSGLAMRAYLQEQIDEHRASPKEDLIGELLVANENGILNDNELLATCILLLIAGNETTTKLIGSSIRSLASNPDQRALLAADPTKIVGAIEEVLRHEGVTTILPRIVKEDTTLGGEQLSAGEFMILLISAANRDPSAFADPSRFDISRSPNHHVAFGHGVHHCLGNRLARMEAQFAVNGFLKRYPTYEVGEFEFAPAFLARGLETMRISAAG
jgi:cytochrome P450